MTASIAGRTLQGAYGHMSRFGVRGVEEKGEHEMGDLVQTIPRLITTSAVLWLSISQRRATYSVSQQSGILTTIPITIMRRGRKIVPSRSRGVYLCEGAIKTRHWAGKLICINWLLNAEASRQTTGKSKHGKETRENSEKQNKIPHPPI